MRYRERSLFRSEAIFLIAFALLAVYMPWRLGWREFYWHEDFFAAQMLEKNLLSPVVTVHGAAVPHFYPLYPSLCAVLYRFFGIPVEGLLRMVSVLFMGGVTILAGMTAWAARRERVAVWVAVCCCATGCFAVEKSIAGYPDAMAAFWILSGQLSYFMLGARNGDWNKAWLVTFFFASLAFLTAGMEAVAALLLPLALMRRPLDVRNKLSKPGFAVGAGLLLLTILWYRWGYFISLKTLPELQRPWPYGSFQAFLWHLLVFPGEAFLRTLPWSILAFAPFCVGLVVHDDPPVLSGFLRRLAGVTFFMLWFTPEINSAEMLALIGSMSIMIGMSYSAAIRRYGSRLNIVTRFFSWVAVLTALAVILFYLAPDPWVKIFWNLPRSSAFRNDPQTFWLGMLCAGSALSIALFGLGRRSPAMPVWVRLLLFSLSMALCYQGVVHPFLATRTERRDLAARIRRSLKGESGLRPVIYKDKRLELYGECNYLGEAVQLIDDVSALPKAPRVVYYLSSEFPQYPERVWRNLLPPATVYDGQRLSLWRGELLREEDLP